MVCTSGNCSHFSLWVYLYLIGWKTLFLKICKGLQGWQGWNLRWRLGSLMSHRSLQSVGWSWGWSPRWVSVNLKTLHLIGLVLPELSKPAVLVYCQLDLGQWGITCLTVLVCLWLWLWLWLPFDDHRVNNFNQNQVTDRVGWWFWPTTNILRLKVAWISSGKWCSTGMTRQSW
jgi:hypothetical protein